MQELEDKRETQIREYSARLNEERKNKENAMRDLAFTIARISPVTSFSIASSELANTSLSLEQNFRVSAETYQKQYADFIYSKTGMNAGGFLRFRHFDDGEQKKPINVHEIPEYIYKQPDLTSILANITYNTGILILFNIIFFAGAFISFRKFDLR